MGKLHITLVDTVGNRRLTVNLPDDVPLEQLVPALARKLRLPEGEYALTVEKTGMPLAAGLTLSEAGVRGGEVLKLQIPLAVEDYLDRGIAHMEQGQYQQAIADYNKAIEIEPDYGETYVWRGRAYSELGQYREAIADFNKAIQIEPNCAEAYMERGLAYQYRLGQYQEAIADYSKAIEIKPHVLAYMKRGHAYFELGQYQEAIADYSKAIEIKPHVLAYSDRGMAYSMLGQHERAQADFDRQSELVYQGK